MGRITDVNKKLNKGRKQLNELITRDKPLNDDKVINKSQEVDQYILEYYKKVRKTE